MADGKLRFGKGNEKVGDAVYTFSIPAGWTCPGALDCLTRADRATGKVTDGPDTTFRCFSAMMEARMPSIRDSRWHNFELLQTARTADAVRDLILASLPRKASIIRIHVGGDFYNREYLRGWIAAATARPSVTFYAYTKSAHLLAGESIPANMVLTLSIGGRYDALIPETGIRTARVVHTEAEAETLGLPIDHDDTHAQKAGGSFALLIHGSQKAGTEASKAVSALLKARKG